jgi:hypothetical protein
MPNRRACTPHRQEIPTWGLGVVGMPMANGFVPYSGS